MVGKTVSIDKWRDAVKFLMGEGTNPTLTPQEQRFLRSHLRGPFAGGMTSEQAVALLHQIGWVST